MKISVLGTGYVGFATGSCLTETDDDILYKNIQKVEKMRQVVWPIYEPHLDTLFERNIRTNRLKFSNSLEVCFDYFKGLYPEELIKSEQKDFSKHIKI